jgi:hypothetical protein
MLRRILSTQYFIDNPREVVAVLARFPGYIDRIPAMRYSSDSKSFAKFLRHRRTAQRRDRHPARKSLLTFLCPKLLRGLPLASLNHLGKRWGELASALQARARRRNVLDHALGIPLEYRPKLGNKTSRIRIVIPAICA